MPVNHSAEIRDQVWRMGPSQWEAAKKLASTIPDPWYRCWALTYVVQKCPETTEKVRIAKQALRSAHEIEDLNRLVTSASWPLSYLVELEPQDTTQQRISKLLGIISAEQHPVRKMDALVALLWGSQSRRSAFLLVWPEFKAACAQAHSWRTDMQLARIASRIDKQYHDLVPELLDMIWSPKERRKAKKKVEKQP
jgi:hypothetical protein